MGPDVTILDFMATLPWFRGASWSAWRVLLAALYALPLSPVDMEVFHRLTGRHVPPAQRVREAWLLLGRRSGKSIIAALVAVYAACFGRYRLGPGERGVVMLICPDRRQSAVLLRYTLGLLESVPALARLIVRRTEDTIDLANGITIEIKTASYRTLRGYTVVVAVVDEVCFLPGDTSVNPDVEIVHAILPAMATVPDALLLCLSSPYARRGAAWEAYRAHWSQDASPVLVANADTATMNPTVPPAVIAEAYARDVAVASAEYGAQFRSDVETYVPFEVLEQALLDGPLERAPEPGQRYVAFVDPSGGSQDSMTLAVAHTEPWDGATIAILDRVDEVRAPFSPEETVATFAERLKAYGLIEVAGDRYAGEWPREAFRRHGIRYAVADKAKSQIYRELLPLLNSGVVGLPDHPTLLRQLVGLERRVSRGGRRDD